MIRLLMALALVLALPFTVSAQRRSVTPPLDVRLAQLDGHRYSLAVEPHAGATALADLRLLHLEIHAAGSRRALTCDSPSRPRTARGIETTTSAWSTTFDIRMICWGRALAALEAGAEIRGTYGRARDRRVPVVTEGSHTHASVALAPVNASAIPASTAPAGDVRISLAPSDALLGTRVSLRVVIRGSRPVRAFLRPDHVRFRVVSPDGDTRTCAIQRVERAPIPDLFARVGTRSGPTYSLDARAYCGPHAFDAAGIYEVTPLVDLDADGAAWRFDTPLGTFEGTPTPVRVRTGAVR